MGKGTLKNAFTDGAGITKRWGSGRESKLLLTESNLGDRGMPTAFGNWSRDLKVEKGSGSSS